MLKKASLVFILVAISITGILIVVRADQPKQKPTIFELIGTTPTWCSDNNDGTKTCTAEIGVPYYEEDGKIKRIDEMNSLKGIVPINVNLDKDYPLEVSDYNYTCYTLKNIEVTAVAKAKGDAPMKLVDASGNEKKLATLKGSVGSKTNMVICDENLSVDTLHYGDKSTTIILQTADTQNLDDSYVTNGDAVNRGSGATLRVHASPTTCTRESYIKFDLSSISANSHVTFANLSLYATSETYTEAYLMDVGVYGVYNRSYYNITNSEWTEETILYSNRPTTSDQYNTTSQFTNRMGYSYTTSTWYNWTVTDIVNKSLTEGLSVRNTTIRLNGTYVSGSETCSITYFVFSSKEDTTAGHRPILNVTYVTGAAPPDTCTYSGSGDWDILCSDNCAISSPVNVNGNKITVKGTGYLTLTANINNFASLYIAGTDSTHLCRVICNGGCFQK